MDIFWEILFVVVLVLLNGFFAASEIAVVSLRRSRTDELIKSGNKRALVVKYFQDNPEKFFATIQVGITFVSTIASAYGGAVFVDRVAVLFRNIPVGFIVSNAQIIAFVLIVIIISYLSLVIGELVPKSFALRFSEKVALFVSYPVKFLSVLFAASIKFLTWSTNLVLIPFKDDVSFAESRISEKELKYLVKEGCKAGSINEFDEKLIENVFEFGDLDVGKVMVPHNKMFVLDIDDDRDVVMNRLMEENYSRIPFYQGRVNNIVGVLYLKDLIWKFAHHTKFDIRDLLRPALFVPASLRLNDVLEKFKEARMHMAVVLDEYGGVLGIVFWL